MNSTRYDRGLIKEKHFTPEGFLRVDAILTRTGVFKYRNADGSIRNELRHPDEILKQDSLKSIEMIPITLNHPTEKIVTAKNFRSLARGYVGQDVKHDNRLIKANILVTDQEAIQAIENGMQELSLGYQTVLVPESGEFNGERYDYKQTEVIYNHLAIVSQGRAGEAKIILDAQDAEMYDHEDTEENNSTTKEKTMPMVKITLDGLQYEVPPEVARHIEKQEKHRTDSENDSVTLKNAQSVLQAKIDSLTEENTALKKIDNAAEIQKGISSRLSLISSALKHLNADEAKDIELKSEKEIKVAVIKKHSPEAKLDDKDDSYINARFDLALEQVSNSEESLAKQRMAGFQKQESNNDSIDADKSREEYVKGLTSAWKIK